jgi:hypothetical protein
MKVSAQRHTGCLYVNIDDGHSSHSIRADGPNTSAEGVIRYHRTNVLLELERLQHRLALYNSALSTLELEQEAKS